MAGAMIAPVILSSAAPGALILLHPLCSRPRDIAQDVTTTAPSERASPAPCDVLRPPAGRDYTMSSRRLFHDVYVLLVITTLLASLAAPAAASDTNKSVCLRGPQGCKIGVENLECGA